jgi:AP-1 complex subunit mu
MVASAIFITDLTGKPLISRNYRGDIPLTSSIETFAKYLLEVEEDVKTPVFHVDSDGEFVGRDDVGCSGVGGEAFVYVQVRFLYFNII